MSKFLFSASTLPVTPSAARMHCHSAAPGKRTLLHSPLLICSLAHRLLCNSDNPNVLLCTTRNGGHTMWCTGTWEISSWVDQVTVQYAEALEALVAARQSARTSSSAADCVIDVKSDDYDLPTPTTEATELQRTP